MKRKLKELNFEAKSNLKIKGIMFLLKKFLRLFQVQMMIKEYNLMI